MMRDIQLSHVSLELKLIAMQLMMEGVTTETIAFFLRNANLLDSEIGVNSKTLAANFSITCPGARRHINALKKVGIIEHTGWNYRIVKHKQFIKDIDLVGIYEYSKKPDERIISSEFSSPRFVNAERGIYTQGWQWQPCRACHRDSFWG
jgi:hypothetical protein